MTTYGKVAVNFLRHDVSGTATDLAVADIAKKDGETFTGTMNAYDLIVANNLTVNGTQTVLNTETLQVEDHLIDLGKVSSPSNASASGGGIKLLGGSDGDKTITWLSSNNAWNFSENIEVASGKNFKVDGTTFFVDATNNKVGIGTISPEGLLHLEASSSGASYTADSADTLILERNGGCVIDFRTPSANDGGLIFSDNDARAQGTVLYNHSDNHLQVGTAGSERFRVGSAGQFGIGGATYGSSGQVLTSGGSSAAPSWTTISAAPTFTATASGAITAADKALILKTDGKVEQIAETSVSAAQGSEVLPGSTSQNKDYVETFSMGTNRFLATWIRTGDSNKLYAAVGTVTGTTIVYGSEVRISNHTNTRENTVDACYDSSIDVGYIMFQAGSATQMRGIGFTFSGTGSSATISQNGTQWSNGGTARQMKCVSDQKGGIYMFYGADSSAPKARCATLATNGAVTPGTEISTFSGANYNNANTADLAYDSAADRVAVVRNNGGQDTQAAILSRSGTLASYSGGASLQGQTRGSEAGIRVIYDTKNDQFLLIFRTYAGGSNNETEGTTFYTNAGKDGWTLGTARFVLSNNRFDDQQADYSESLQKAFFFMQNDSAGNTSVITLTGTGGQGGTYSASMDVAFSYNVSSVAGAALSNGKIVLGQRNSSNRFATKVWQIAYTATNLESNNFIGFSAGSYSDGDTATVKIDSNTTTQSSLTPVKTYYIQRDGTLGIAAATPSQVAGKALSSTSLLIKY